jgi:hypothetical protein
MIEHVFTMHRPWVQVTELKKREREGGRKEGRKEKRKKEKERKAKKPPV